MSGIAQIIDTLENRIGKLLGRMEELERKSAKLEEELKNSAQLVQRQTGEIGALTQKYDMLKTASALLGSEENKRDTKLKINSLIREIDHCIAQMAD